MTTAAVHHNPRLLGTMMLMAACVAVSVGLFIIYFWTERQHTPVLLFAVLVPLICTAPFYARLRRIVADRHFSRVEVVLGTSRPHLGQTVPVRLSLTARHDLLVPAFRFRLRAVEEVHPPHARTCTREVFQSVVDVPTGAQLTKDRPYDLETEVHVPAQGMETFEGHGVGLRWYLDAFATVKEPILLGSCELSVQPMLAGPSRATGAERAAGDRLRMRVAPGDLQVGQVGLIEVVTAPELARENASLQTRVFWTAHRRPDEGDASATVERSREELRTVFVRTVNELHSARSFSFEFVVPPAGPISYAGELFSIEWTARTAVLTGDGRTVESVDVPLTVLPRPAHQA